jgi:hypothetical protein
MKRSLIGRIGAGVLAVLLLAANAPVAMTGQLLAYQNGFVFFTTGDGFRVSPSVKILDIKTQQPTSEIPRARGYARAVFDESGAVAELDLSKAALPFSTPPEARKFAVTASPFYPNPELVPQGAPSNLPAGAGSIAGSGRPVLVTITVQVPPATPATASIYMATDTSGWNAQAIQLDRVDALHFRISRRIASGTVLHYFYTRGSLQSEEVAENGLSRAPRAMVLGDADVRAVNDVVYGWADATTYGQASQPDAIPTPYNPAPFPNLPAGEPTPHP